MNSSDFSPEDVMRATSKVTMLPLTGELGVAICIGLKMLRDALDEPELFRFKDGEDVYDWIALHAAVASGSEEGQLEFAKRLEFSLNAAIDELKRR